MPDWGVVHPSGLAEIVDGVEVDVPTVVVDVGGDVVVDLEADFRQDPGRPGGVGVTVGEGLCELLLVLFQPVGGRAEGLVSDEPGAGPDAGWDIVVGRLREKAGHVPQLLEGLFGLVPGREFAVLEVVKIVDVEPCHGLAAVEVRPGVGLVEQGGVTREVVGLALPDDGGHGLGADGSERFCLGTSGIVYGGFQEVVDPLADVGCGLVQLRCLLGVESGRVAGPPSGRLVPAAGGR